MSIAAVSGSSVFGVGYNINQSMNSSRNSGPSSDDIAASIVEKDDADGDGLLSLDETPLDEDRFNSIDADGDGFISAEELSADAQKHMNARSAFMGQLTLKMQDIDTGELAASIIENDDADGDGVLSLDETPLDEDTFNSIDTDGDGFITAEELSTDMEANMAQGMSAPPPGSNAQASETGSSGAQSEEEYDEYDLNKDGVVSFDELLQAYNEGDNSLNSVFQSMGGTASGLTNRLAMRAYQAQMI